ncbi:MAG: arginyltransferase [Deltaproteobacteria bacterium]|nr:arginyltransferase [Deltaproteobacteria bacterium]
MLVHDAPGPCPYIDGEIARLPFRLPVRRLEPDELDERLRAGDRRQGAFLYRPDCPSCRACIPLRLDVNEFVEGRTHRRILRRGVRELRVEAGRPLVDDRRVELYNLHRRARGLDLERAPISADGYREFLGRSSCDSFELRFSREGRLVAVAIVDRSAEALSAVYCHYDPAILDLSPGTFSILVQVALCRAWGLRHLYLGLYVEGSEIMEYKARFLPHERRVDGAWQKITEYRAPAPRRAPGQRTPTPPTP